MSRPEVFLSHAGADKESVKAIALHLQRHSIQTWLDEWNLIPGDPWIDSVGRALQECSSCIVFIGPGGEAPWHSEEVRSALDRCIRERSFRIVPALLPGARPERASHLPGFLANRHWVAFSKGLDDPDAIHRLVCGVRGIEPGPSAGAPHVPGRNPYRGLRVFDVDDAPLFFGRELLTQQLLDKLAPSGPYQPRFVSVLGSSGSGKSSLARAGLLASLRAGGLPGSAAWPQIVIRPGAYPLESLAAGLGNRLAPAVDPGELIRRLQSAEEALHRQVKMALHDHPERRAVLLVDQAEEAFTLCARESDRAAFFANLLYAATVRTGQTLVVLTFRADFYPRLAEHRQLAALVSENQMLVPSMTGDELRRAIVGPAERGGRPLHPVLVTELLADSAGRPGFLPLLEHALAQLWERPERELRLEEYRLAGGMAGALNARAEAIFGSLVPAHQAACRRLFHRLVQPGEDALDTRRRVRREELPADQEEVSQAFAAEGVHLLTWSREGERQFLEVAHEELIRRWDRLQGWVREDRRGQQTHRRLMTAAAEWSARGRHESFLYRGVALAEVEEWLARLPEQERASVLNSTEAEFLEQGRAAERRRAEEIALLRVAQQQARQHEAVALSRELADTVAARLGGDPQLNLALLKEARRLAETDKLFSVLAGWANAGGRALLRGHSGPVWSAAFSPDGRCAVTASADRTARIWEAATGKLLATLSGHLGWVRSASFSPDGLRVVTAGEDGTARAWETATGALLATLSGHSGWMRSAVFSADGQRILTAGEDGTARVWEAGTGEPLVTLSGHSGQVWSAGFDQDGRRAVTASADGTARIWETGTGKSLAVLAGHSGPVWSAGFSPDGRRAVTASGDRTARIWETGTGEPLATLSGHSDSVQSAAFSVDGQRVVTASGDRTARVWEAGTGKLLATLSGHSSWVRSAELSPDGRRVVTASDDHTARVWQADTGKPLATLSGHSGWVWSAAFSPDGRRVVTASRDKTARVWAADTGQSLATFRGHSGWVQSAAFSPDGHRVVTASDEDATAQVWKAATGKGLATLSGHTGAVWSAGFSPDGHRVVTASDDGTARIWESDSGLLLAALSGHSASVWSAGFSSDGRRVVTASGDGTARIWETATGRLLATLSGHSASVQSAVFNPDGQCVVTASGDGTARIWETATGRTLATLSGHAGPVWSAGFSPDGLRVVTASADGTARVWEAATGRTLATLSGHSSSVRSAVFSPDGLRIATASGDRTALLWQDLLWAPHGKQLELLDSGRELTPEERRTFLREAAEVSSPAAAILSP